MKNRWILQHEPEAQKMLEGLKTGLVPALTAYQSVCKVFHDQIYEVLSTECILEQDSKISSNTK